MGYFIFYQEDDERDEDYWAAIYFDEANKQKANEYVYTRHILNILMINPLCTNEFFLLVCYNETCDSP